MRALREEKAEAEAAKKVSALTADVTANIHRLARLVQVLALENHERRSVGDGPGNVVPLRTTAFRADEGARRFTVGQGARTPLHGFLQRLRRNYRFAH